MVKRTVTPFSFGRCYVQSQARFRVIAQIDELSNSGSTDSEVFTYKIPEQQWLQFSFAWSAVGIATRSEPSELYVLGPSGEVFVHSSVGQSEESLDDSTRGPRGRGPMRNI